MKPVRDDRDEIDDFINDVDSKVEQEKYVYSGKTETLETMKAKNSKATEFDVMIANLTGSHSARFNDILSTMPDKDFVNAYLSVLPYLKPKFKSIDTPKREVEKRTLEIIMHKEPPREM